MEAEEPEPEPEPEPSFDCDEEEATTEVEFRRAGHSACFGLGRAEKVAVGRKVKLVRNAQHNTMHRASGCTGFLYLLFWLHLLPSEWLFIVVRATAA